MTSKRDILILLQVALYSSLAYLPVLHAEEAFGGESQDGRSIYDYYCYQCHGYKGDAKTVASAFLEPKPRNFTSLSLGNVSRSSMLETVLDGRPGTAMVSFRRVLKQQEIEAVVDYVRNHLMKNDALTERYHTKANGWPDHERFEAAFPFVTGQADANTPWEMLDERLRSGRQLYQTACITCHENEQTTTLPEWEPRAVSYPRKHYSHAAGDVDALSGATVYALHERNTPDEHLDEQGKKGKQLYVENCAFCHAPDGSSRNWIGSFLEPRPRDFTQPGIIDGMSPQYLHTVIRDGLPGTSMPAWQQILSMEQIEDISAYLKQSFAGRKGNNQTPTSEDRSMSRVQISPAWHRVPNPAAPVRGP